MIFKMRIDFTQRVSEFVIVTKELPNQKSVILSEGQSPKSKDLRT